MLLEEEYLGKNCSINTIQELTKIYSDLTEYYDNRKDPIKGYFMERI